jgi:hypothetical protein
MAACLCIEERWKLPPALPTSVSELVQSSSFPFIASSILVFMCLGYNV